MPSPLVLSCGRARTFTGTALRPSGRGHAQRAAPARGVSRNRAVRVYARDWANPDEGATEANRAEGAGSDEAGEEANGIPADLRCQTGDIVTVSWECALASTGQVVDSSSRGPMARHMEFQLGQDAGFQPKRGLMLAYSIVAEGLCIGETARVIARTSGGGWFKAYEVLSEDGQLLSQLSNEEKQSEWADEEAVYTMEVLKIVPPRGRKLEDRRG